MAGRAWRRQQSAGPAGASSASSAPGSWAGGGAGAVDAGQREQLDPLAVDADLELLRLRVDRHLFVEIARQLHANRVLRVHRERVADRRAAARAEQLAGQAIVLREIVGDAEIVDGRQRRRRADRRAADLLRRRQIPLHQRRRQLQHARNVVEAVARVVGRKKRRDVDVEIEQVADRVLVFRAVQPVERLGPARIRIQPGAAIELAFEPRQERVVAASIGTRHAGRRHETGAHLPHDAFPRLRVGAHVGRDRACRTRPEPCRAASAAGCGSRGSSV